MQFHKPFAVLMFIGLACGCGNEAILRGDDSPSLPVHDGVSLLAQGFGVPTSVTDGAPGGNFGSSVALSSDTALVGARNVDAHGAAYVFVLQNSTWIQQAKLVSSDGGNGDDFGYAVAIDGDTALVGAFLANQGTASTGAAYVFVRQGGSWTQQAKLVAPDGQGFDLFGSSVALAGDTALVGAFQANGNASRTGAAYVFVRNGGTWNLQTKLTANDSAQYDDFGISVSISGDTAVIGADTHEAQGEASGAVYIFARNGGTWQQQAKLLASDGGVDRFFGNPVAIRGNTAFVGTYLQDGASLHSGAAYVFERVGETWQETVKLKASDGLSGDGFGISLGVCGEALAVGAYGVDNVGQDAGSVYVFRREANNWNSVTKLFSTGAPASSEFGTSVALSPRTLAVGAPYDDQSGVDSGAAYFFPIQNAIATGACDDDADCLSGHCNSGVCSCDAWPDGAGGAGGGVAAGTGGGSVPGIDVGGSGGTGGTGAEEPPDPGFESGCSCRMSNSRGDSHLLMLVVFAAWRRFGRRGHRRAH